MKTIFNISTHLCTWAKVHQLKYDQLCTFPLSGSSGMFESTCQLGTGAVVYQRRGTRQQQRCFHPQVEPAEEYNHKCLPNYFDSGRKWIDFNIQCECSHFMVCHINEILNTIICLDEKASKTMKYLVSVLARVESSNREAVSEWFCKFQVWSVGASEAVLDLVEL